MGLVGTVMGLRWWWDGGALHAVGSKQSGVGFGGPGSPTERAEERQHLGVSVGGPDGHAVVVQEVSTPGLAGNERLALHHHRQADRALRLLVVTAIGA